MVKEYVPNESRKAKFDRLATKRTKKILELIRVLGHCSNRNQYEYSEEDVNKIFKAITGELKSVKSKFEKTQNTHFSLK